MSQWPLIVYQDPNPAARVCPRGWKLNVSNRSVARSYSSLHSLLSQFKKIKKHMSVIAAVRSFGLCDKPRTWRGSSGPNTHTEIQCCSPSPFVLNLNSPTVRHTLAVDAEKHCAVTLQLNRWAAGGASWQTRARRKTWHQIWTEVDRLDNSASWEKYSESSTV